MQHLTHSEVKDIFHYSHDTGEFYKRSGGCIRESKNGYLRVSHGNKSMAVHKVAWFYMTGEWPDSDIDHIDHNRKNNKWSNLRLATRQENMRNATRSKSNTSGFTGVTWCKQQKQWQAQITVSGKCIKLGRFDDINDAISARKQANKVYGFHANHGKKICHH